MNVTCPSHSVKSLEEAVLSFQGGSFLTPYTRRTSDGVLSKKHFLDLLNNAYKSGKYIKYNAYSFKQLASSVNREYCYYLERFIFYDKLYINTRIPEYRDTSTVMEKKMKDLLTCIDYLEDLQINGDDSFMVNPTKDRAPLSSNQRIDLSEAMTDTKDPTLRDDMLEYSLEKNRSAQSLLAVYGFLNLTAVALLIYIYRAR